MIRRILTIVFFLLSGIVSLIGLIVSELGAYKGGLSSMVGAAFTICIFIAVYLSYLSSGLSLGGLRKTPYYQYGDMEMEWYRSATPTTCGCCLGPFLIMAVLFIASGYENSELVFVLYIVAGVLSMFGGLTTEYKDTHGE